MACFSIVNGYLKYISKNKLFLRVDYHALRIKLMLKQFRCLKFTDCHKVVTLIKYQVSNKINRLLFENSFCIDDNKITIEPFCIYEIQIPIGNLVHRIVEAGRIDYLHKHSKVRCIFVEENLKFYLYTPVYEDIAIELVLKKNAQHSFNFINNLLHRNFIDTLKTLLHLTILGKHYF